MPGKSAHIATTGRFSRVRILFQKYFDKKSRLELFFEDSNINFMVDEDPAHSAAFHAVPSILQQFDQH